MRLAPWVGQSYPKTGRVAAACRRSQTLLSDARTGVHGSPSRPLNGARVEPTLVTLPTPARAVAARLRGAGGVPVVLERGRGWSRPRRAT